MRSHNSGNIQGENLHFSALQRKKFISRKRKYVFTKTAPQLLGYIGLKNMKVGEKTNFGRVATIFQICSMDADILS